MLRDKDRMMTHRRLLPIINRRGRRQPLLDEISRVLHDNCQSFAPQVLKLFALQAKAAPEGRAS